MKHYAEEHLKDIIQYIKLYLSFSLLCIVNDLAYILLIVPLFFFQMQHLNSVISPCLMTVFSGSKGSKYVTKQH